ncbi:MAG: FadR/GntR family transcriptional regulator, partial [Pseudomonadota bacterium]
RLSEGILEQLKAMLLARGLKPGDKLPSERELAMTFKVGRPSVREAIRTLDILGILDIRPGEGIFVKEPNVNAYLTSMQEALEMLVELEEKTFLEILEVRSILESHTASLAAKNATKDDLALLDQAFQDQTNTLPSLHGARSHADAQAYIDADFAFHKAVAVCSHNGVLCVMINFIKTLVQRTSRKFLFLPNMIEVSTEFLQEHYHVMRAIKGHSPEEATRAMSVHLKHAQSVMARLIISKKDLESHTTHSPDIIN